MLIDPPTRLRRFDGRWAITILPCLVTLVVLAIAHVWKQDASALASSTEPALKYANSGLNYSNDRLLERLYRLHGCHDNHETCNLHCAACCTTMAPELCLEHCDVCHRKEQASANHPHQAEFNPIRCRSGAPCQPPAPAPAPPDPPKMPTDFKCTDLMNCIAHCPVCCATSVPRCEAHCFACHDNGEPPAHLYQLIHEGKAYEYALSNDVMGRLWTMKQARCAALRLRVNESDAARLLYNERCREDPGRSSGTSIPGSPMALPPSQPLWPDDLSVDGTHDIK